MVFQCPGRSWGSLERRFTKSRNRIVGIIEITHNKDPAQRIEPEQRIHRMIQHPPRRRPFPTRRSRPAILRRLMNNKNMIFPTVIPGLIAVIPGLIDVIPGLIAVIPGLTRNLSYLCAYLGLAVVCPPKSASKKKSIMMPSRYKSSMQATSNARRASQTRYLGWKRWRFPQILISRS